MFLSVAFSKSVIVSWASAAVSACRQQNINLSAESIDYTR